MGETFILGISAMAVDLLTAEKEVELAAVRRGEDVPAPQAGAAHRVARAFSPKAGAIGPKPRAQRC